MFIAVDAGETELVNRIDQDEVDPIFGAIEAMVDGAAGEHRAEALRELDALGQTQRVVVVTTPIVFLLGLGLLGLFWLVIRELLLPLARAYGVPLDELVGAPATEHQRIHAQPFTRGGTAFLPLTRRSGGLHAYKVVIPTDRIPEKSNPKEHGDYVWLYVLSGQLQLVLGEHDLVPRAG